MNQELRDLLAAWMGSELAPERCQELAARIREDESFRLAFVDEIRILGMLKPARSSEPRWLRLEDELGWTEQARPVHGDIEEGVMRRLPRRRGWPIRPSSREWGALAGVALLAFVSWIAFRQPNVGPQRKAGTTPVSKITPSLPLATLAMVVKLESVKWTAASGSAPSEGDAIPATRLCFDSGRVLLALLNGVTLIIEGPADVSLVSLDRVDCQRGKVRTRVPEGANGFVVSAPGAAVLDLGTEFALNVDPSGKSRVMVFEGEAEVMVLNEQGSTRRSQLVAEHQAYEIDPKTGHIEESAARSDSFVVSATLPPPSLALDASYPSAVMQSRPWGYWRFESMKDGVVPNEVVGGPPLRATGPLKLSAPKAGNRSIVFKDNEPLQYLEMDGLWKPNHDAGCAVELWVMSELIKHSSLACLIEPWDAKTTLFKHLFFVELTVRERQSLQQPASVRFAHRWPPRPSGGENIYSKQYYVPYRWHHVVAQMLGDRMELYVDGVLSRSTALDPAHKTMPCKLIFGRLNVLPNPPSYELRHLAGRLDEAALYDHPLTAEEISRNHRLGSALASHAQP
jgi:Concanavalin A-like lectin/glucanases superfamily